MRGLLNPFGKVLLIQIFQESKILFRATVTINTTREKLEVASNELNGKILLGRPIVTTFKRVPKKIVTGATKVKARVVSEEAEEEDSQEPRTRTGSRKPRGYELERTVDTQPVFVYITAVRRKMSESLIHFRHIRHEL